MKRFCVYKIVNKINKRTYFGVSQEFQKRRNSHINQLKKGIHNNTYLQDDWDKYGENKFYFMVVKSFGMRKEAEDYEMFLVQKYDNIYNIVKDSSVGGDVFSHNPNKENIRAQKREQMSGKNNHQFGKPKTDKMINAVKKANSKKVTINGVTYVSAAEASRQLGIKHTTLLYRVNSNSEHFKEWYYN